MLCCSTSYSVDSVDQNSAFINGPNNTPFSKLNFAGFVRENMMSTCLLDGVSSPDLPSTSSQCVNPSDILEHMSEDDILSIIANSGMLDSMDIYTDESTSTSPSISPRSDSSEETASERRMIYWNDYIKVEPNSIDETVTDPIISNCLSLDSSNSAATPATNGLLCAATPSQNSTLYSIVKNSNTVDSSESFFDLDSIKLEPLDGDSGANLDLWSSVIDDIPATSPIMTNCHSLGSSNCVMTRANNGLSCAATSSQNSGLCSLVDDFDTVDNSPESYLNLGMNKKENSQQEYWDKIIGDLPIADPIISNCHPVDSSNSLTTLANRRIHASISSQNSETSLLYNSNTTENLDCFLNIDSIKKEPSENDSVDIDITSVCTNPEDFMSMDFMSSLDIFTGNETEVMNVSDDEPTSYSDDVSPDLSDILLRPESANFPISTFPTDSEPSNFDLHIPCSSSADVLYSDKDEYHSSFENSEESRTVNISDVCPFYHRNRVVEPFARPILKYRKGYTRRLRPIDKVKNDHCYTKTEIEAEPAPLHTPLQAAPLQSAMNYNYFLEDVNKIPIPVKRRPGRPRKCATAAPVPKKTRVISLKAPQKGTKRATRVPMKRRRMQVCSEAESAKRKAHNLAERERRSALRDSMFSVARQCPENVLNLTEVALASTKTKRSEDVENNFTVDVLRRVDDLMRRDFDRRLLKIKKSPGHSKMVMLLGITYHLTSLEKDLKSKEVILSRNDSTFRHASSKLVKRIRRNN